MSTPREVGTGNGRLVTLVGSNRDENCLIALAFQFVNRKRIPNRRVGLYLDAEGGQVVQVPLEYWLG
jgi:hypothetical protein